MHGTELAKDGVHKGKVDAALESANRHVSPRPPDQGEIYVGQESLRRAPGLRDESEE